MAGAVGVKAGQALVGREGTWVWCGCLLALARVAANSVKSTPLYEEVRKAADQYEHSGVPLSVAFNKFTSVDDQVTHMMSIGERSASIDSQLKMLSEMYEEESENHMNDFTQVLNFIVLITAVSLIGAVFIGTFLPIFLMGPKMMQSGI